MVQLCNVLLHFALPVVRCACLQADPGLAHSDSLSLAAGGGLSARDEAGRPLPPALAMA
jgi:hypothetical protein